MIYKEFKGMKLSQLGFGTMRLPQCKDAEGNPCGVDEALVDKMIDYAMEHGINYYDTAYPYMNGQSESIVGKSLNRYPRESFYLATKYPGHMHMKNNDPKTIFEEQLKKCGVDYFDFYLLHNVYENSLATYKDPKLGVLDYFLKEKEAGRIKYLGFSTHGSPDNLKEILDYCGDKMDFCQIQLNYLDWTLQQAEEKCRILNEHNLPIWVMEPVRGGQLAKLSEAEEEKLKAKRQGESIPAWSFRFLQGIPGVTVILSGMSDMEQMQDNVKTFEEDKPLNPDERKLVLDIAEGMKDSVPCTACRYCCDGCPRQLDIPKLLSEYNQLRFSADIGVGMRMDAVPEDKKPQACIGCGACSAVCPQKIDIPAAMQDFAEKLSALPSWAEICKQREAARQD